MASLQPPPVPLGVNSEFIYQQPVAILLKERVMSLSGDTFHVQTLPQGPDNPNVTGPALFQIQGEALSLSQRKHFLTESGQNIYDVRKEHFTLLSNFYAEDSSGRQIWKLDGKFSIGSSKAVCKFTGVSGQQHSLLMKGNFFDSYAEIKDEETGNAVARIIRKRWNARDLVWGQQTYVVEVAANVDVCLIAAMCVCLDERKNEK